MKKVFLLLVLLMGIFCTEAYGTDTIYLPSDTHPRVLLNREFITFLKNNRNREDVAPSYKYLLELAQKKLPAQPEKKNFRFQ